MEINAMAPVIDKALFGPNGTICVQPELFHGLVSMQDAILLGCILFALGIGLGAILWHMRSKYGS